METIIETFKHGNVEITIKFASGDGWSDMKDKFFAEADFNFGKMIYNKDIDIVRRDVKVKINEWIKSYPINDEGWVKLIESCVIQDGYEDWHIDPILAMTVLKKYHQFKSK